MSKIRVYELAKQLKLSNKDLVTILEKLGVQVKSHMSSLEDDLIKKVTEIVQKEKKTSQEKLYSEAGDSSKDGGKTLDPTRQGDGQKTDIRIPEQTSADRSQKLNHQGHTNAGSGQKENSKLGVTPQLGQTRDGKAKQNVSAQTHSRTEDSVSKNLPSQTKKVSQSWQQSPESSPVQKKHEKIEEKGSVREPTKESPSRENSKDVFVPRGANVKDIADLLKISAGEAVKKLMSHGMMLPATTAANDDILLALSDACGVSLDWAKEEPKPEIKQSQPSAKPKLRGSHLRSRPPIVTVMGHVDHGKTSLLDAIRKTRVTAQEAGGITQHIGASHVIHAGQEIVFLDTPGHAAFTSMRARGAQITDIAVLVVAADDGVMPQTVEAINHAKAAKVPIIVAINKMDKPTANPDQVMQQLSGYGLIAEKWGGDTVMVPISAKTGKGIDQLLEMIQLVAEMQELKADPTVEPEGVVIEARLDKGKGPMASILVQQGTLRTGNMILLDSSWGRIRAMLDDTGKTVKSAGPSTAVEVLGLSDVPQPGEHFHLIKNEKEARDHFGVIDQQRRDSQSAAVKRMTLEDLYSQMKDGDTPILNIVVKCDVQGTSEAIVSSLEKLATNEVGINIVHSSVGRISESDVMLASASNAIIVGFNVRPDPNASKLAEQENVQIRLYSIIYEIIDDVKAAMEGLLAPKVTEQQQGQVEILKIFKAPKIGKIAGCRVTSGVIKRNSKVRLVREGVVVWDSTVASLHREKDDASEVNAGFECGITFTNHQDFEAGDIVEAYELVEEKRTL